MKCYIVQRYSCCPDDSPEIAKVFKDQQKAISFVESGDCCKHFGKEDLDGLKFYKDDQGLYFFMSKRDREEEIEFVKDEIQAVKEDPLQNRTFKLYPYGGMGATVKITRVEDVTRELLFTASHSFCCRIVEEEFVE